MRPKHPPNGCHNQQAVCVCVCVCVEPLLSQSASCQFVQAFSLPALDFGSWQRARAANTSRMRETGRVCTRVHGMGWACQAQSLTHMMKALITGTTPDSKAVMIRLAARNLRRPRHAGRSRNHTRQHPTALPLALQAFGVQGPWRRHPAQALAAR